MGKGTKASQSPPGWKALLASGREADTANQRSDLASPIIERIEAILEEHAAVPPVSQKLFTALGIANLNTAVAGLDPADPTSVRALLTVNHVLGGSPAGLAAVLVEQDFVTSLVRLHKRTADLSAPLSHACILLLTHAALAYGATAGPAALEAVASRAEACELLVSHLVYGAVQARHVRGARGVASGQRCVQALWELTRGTGPGGRALRQLLSAAAMPDRLLALAAHAMGGGAEGAEAQEAGPAAATITAPDSTPAAGAEAAAAPAAGLAALTLTDAPASSPSSSSTPAPAAAATQSLDPPAPAPARLALAAAACSLAANLAGLGSRGVELSAEGLAPQREWLLGPGRLGALAAALRGLCAGLGECWRGGEGGEAEEDGREGEEEGEAAELGSARLARARLLSHVEGALRNLLVLLGLPTIVMGRGQEDVVEGARFVVRAAYGMLQEGYVDVARELRAAVTQPPAPAAAAAGPAAYPGDYGAFLRAYAAHLESLVPGLGSQLAEWGVRFPGEGAGEPAEGSLMVMEVGEGVDAAAAQAWVAGQLQAIVDWGRRMMALVRLADQAKMPAGQGQAGQGQAR